MEKNLLRDLTYGMYVVTTSNAGCIINTMTQITSENPIISISINKNKHTNEKLKEERNFAVSIISEKTNPNLISVFGFSSSSQRPPLSVCSDGNSSAIFWKKPRSRTLSLLK
jgi:flavin reductase (DIM6/NTAB) family NADH-FMN oxidoreductase RutF